MRFLTIAVAVSALALATGAFAQTAPKSVATGEAQQQLPRWDKEDKIPYKPCPTSVVLADGRHVLSWLPGAHF
jgi:hypothetical protein